MNSDEERVLFELWGWTFDSVARLWRAPRHGHADESRARRRPGRKVEIPTSMCETTLSLDDLVMATQTPEGEGALVGFVMAHGVRKR